MTHPMAEPWLSWRLLADGAPIDGTPVLVSDGVEFASSQFTNGRWIVSPQTWSGDGDTGGLADLEFEPTHWTMPPLPRS